MPDGKETPAPTIIRLAGGAVGGQGGRVTGGGSSDLPGGGASAAGSAAVSTSVALTGGEGKATAGSMTASVSLALSGGVVMAVAGSLEGWATYSFAPEWFREASEAGQSAGSGSRRHEIIFAVCATEAYLFEWVRDEVLSRDFAAISAYFPASDRSGILDRMKKVTKDLKSRGKISTVPSWGTVVWKDFYRLVKLRDGIVHANSSRPDNSERPDDERPFPNPTALSTTIQPGYVAVFS